MANKNGLEFVGFLFGGITFAMTLITFVVVQNHVQGNLALDEVATAPQLVSFSPR